jgi:formylglycine-generating enzyme required for sulfatase activity
VKLKLAGLSLLWLAPLALGQTTARPDPNQGKRYALLLANANYERLPGLKSPPLDLRTLQSALTESGFNVAVAENFTLTQLLTGIEKNFLQNLSAGDICFIFYAGHALQMDGDNYILPVEFNPAAQGDINLRARSVTGLLQNIESKKVGLKMLALDASRSVPALSSYGRGLTGLDLTDSQEVIVAFSADRDALAPEAPQNQPDRFSSALAQAIRVPGLSAAQMFLTAQREVAAATNRAQLPYVQPKAISSFMFRAPEPVVTARVNNGPGKSDLRSNRTDRQEYVWVLPGTFQMGCVPSDTRCEAVEKPRHEVTISKGFWMGRTEVETRSYQRYVAEDKKSRSMPSAPMWDRKFNNVSHPVVGMNWEEAQAYCRWAGGRLPTEAEWEYAARAGAANEIYPLNAEDSRDKANFTGKKGNDQAEYTAPVRSYDQNAFGLYDMAGNVWEWTADWFAPDYYANSPKTDPTGPAMGRDRVARGGSWDSDPKQHLRISFRQPYGKGGNKVGFRCVLEDNAETQKRLN